LKEIGQTSKPIFMRHNSSWNPYVVLL